MSTDLKKISGLYAITQHDHLSDDVLFKDVEAVLSGGAQMLQFRDKSNNIIKRKERAQILLQQCRRHNALLLINDDVELCKMVQADGVHLGQSDQALDAARQQLGDKAIIGISCHNSLELAVKAQKQGANYIALGRFFPSKTKPDAPQADISLIRQVRQQCSLPLVAIGGITLDNAGTLLNEGVDALALIHDLWASKNIQQQAQTYCQLINHKNT